ncbi:protein kinase [Akkermansiaceae bacterium]|nr:protein kinase [Akkermansiaceae bacterium]
MSNLPDRIQFEAPEATDLQTMLNGYTVINLIAKGGMGAVYLGIQNSLERKVAIKILPKEFGQDETFFKAFEQEARTMARINHPNLLSVYDFGEIQGMLFLIMEYAEGKSLFDLAEAEELDEVLIAKLGSQIAYGLAAAHDSGVLHRDIKPSNILLTLKNECKISDFGLARPVGEVESGIIYGTPGYTAPEVINKPTAVDDRADIFSVGVIIYELLTGRLPSKNYITANSIRECSETFDNIIRKAIHPSAKMRYRSARELADALNLLFNSLKPSSGTGKFETNVKSKLLTDTSPLNIQTSSGSQKVNLKTGLQPVRNATAPVGVLLTNTSKITTRTTLVAGRTGPVTSRTSPVNTMTSRVTVNTNLKSTNSVSAAAILQTGSHAVRSSADDDHNLLDTSAQSPNAMQAMAVAQASEIKRGNKKLVILVGVIITLLACCFIVISIANNKDEESNKNQKYNALNDGESNSEDRSSQSNSNNSSKKPYIVKQGDLDTHKVQENENTVKTITIKNQQKTSHEEAIKQLKSQQLNLLNGIINADELPTNTITRGGKFFLYINQKMSWHDADLFCSAHGGFLAVATETADISFLAKNAPENAYFWVGAGSTPSSKVAQVNGEKFVLSSRGSDMKFFAYSSSNNRTQQFAKEEYPFFIQWNVKGDSHGDTDSRLLRTYLSYKDSETSFPPGSTGNISRRYAIIRANTTYSEAENVARYSGGHLAVISNPQERQLIEQYINNSLPENQAIWIGTSNQRRILQNSSIEQPIAQVMNDLKMKNNNAAIASAAENKVTYSSQDINQKADYFIIEWSKDEDSGIKDIFQFGEFTSLSDLQQTLKLRVKIEEGYYRKQLGYKASRIAWIIKTWKNNATLQERIKYDSITTELLLQAESTNFIPGQLAISKLPSKLQKQVSNAIEEYNRLPESHNKALRAFKDVYIANLKRLLAGIRDKNSREAQIITQEIKKNMRVR